MPINVVPQFLHGKFRYAVAPAGIPGTPGILGIPGIPEITNQFRKVNLRGSTSGSISSFASAPVPTGIPGIPGMLSMKKKRGENQRLTGEVAPRIPVVTPPPPPPSTCRFASVPAGIPKMPAMLRMAEATVRRAGRRRSVGVSSFGAGVYIRSCRSVMIEVPLLIYCEHILGALSLSLSFCSSSVFCQSVFPRIKLGQ